jgi:uncharacterized protein (DUF302 family)
MTRTARLVSLSIAVVVAFLLLLATPAAADGVSYTRKGIKYDDARLDLESAIVDQGLKIDHVGNVAAMLQRTGADVGSDKPVYRHGEYLTFCSARLSRAMMEADPANMAQCPYVMFVYERAEAPGEITIGYRKLGVSGSGAKVLEEINALLDKIARAAVR